jgi:L-cysteine/cystine lyase
MSGTDAHTKDLKEHRSYFAALANKAYFNYGGQGVLSKQAVSGIFCSYDYVQTNGPFSLKMFDWMSEELNRTKEVLAKELHASTKTIALTTSVTEGCNIVMWGIDWKPGDHLLTTDSEHPSIVVIAEQLAKRRGVQVALVPVSEPAVDPVKAIADNLTSKTKLVVLSHVLWNTGRILPIKEIAALCRERGVPLLVDGAQSAGIMPVDVQALDIDFFAMTGHKWYCGPEGVSALYVRESMIPQVEATFVGWRGMNFEEGGLVSDAAKFEIATAPFPLLAGLREAIALHNEWAPMAERYAQVRSNVTYLREQLAKIPGAKLAYDGELAGLVAFSIEGKRPKDIVRKAEAERVMLRTIPYPDAVRASIHYLTNRRELDRLAEVLASC